MRDRGRETNGKGGRGSRELKGKEGYPFFWAIFNGPPNPMGICHNLHSRLWPFTFGCVVMPSVCISFEDLSEFGFLGKSLKNRGFDHLLDFDLKFLVSHGNCFCICLLKIQLSKHKILRLNTVFSLQNGLRLFTFLLSIHHLLENSLGLSLFLPLPLCFFLQLLSSFKAI